MSQLDTYVAEQPGILKIENKYYLFLDNIQCCECPNKITGVLAGNGYSDVEVDTDKSIVEFTVPNKNFDTFLNAISQLEKLGYVVVNTKEGLNKLDQKAFDSEICRVQINH